MPKKYQKNSSTNNNSKQKQIENFLLSYKFACKVSSSLIVMIDNKSLQKLENKTYDQVQIAFDKNMSSRQYGQNGIKVLKSIIELKTNNDFRLFTKTKYNIKNCDIQIAVLNKSGNHKQIKRMNQSKISNIEEITIECFTEKFLTKNLTDMDYPEDLFNSFDFIDT